MTLSKDTRIKLEKFHRDKRAWRSFLTLIALFLITLPAEWVCNVRPLLLVVDGRPYFPVLFTYSETDFGGRLPSERAMRIFNLSMALLLVLSVLLILLP